MLRILHNTHIEFVGRWRRVAIVIIAFLLPAVVWIAVSTAQGGLGNAFHMGIEFTGGTAVQYTFQSPPDLARVRTTVAAAGFPSAEVQTFGSPNDIVVRAQELEDAAGEGPAASVSTRVTEALGAEFGAETFTLARREAIGPRVGAELRRNAIIAMLLSFVVTLIYLAWRFDGRLAVASILANVHDIIATFAFIKYMNIEMSLFVGMIRPRTKTTISAGTSVTDSMAAAAP